MGGFQQRDHGRTHHAKEVCEENQNEIHNDSGIARGMNSKGADARANSIADLPMNLRKNQKYFIPQVVEQKELTIAELENKKLQEQAAAEQAAEKLAQKESEKCTSPRKDKWQSILEIPDISSMSPLMFRDQLNRSAQANV